MLAPMKTCFFALIPMIQLSTRVALQYEPGIKLFPVVTEEVHDINNHKVQHYCEVFLEVFLKYSVVYNW